MNDKIKNTPKVSAIQPITPHNQALYEAGKKLLIDSLETGREFCKFMITTSMAAMPVYLALLNMVLPEAYRPTIWIGSMFLMPPVLFLVAAIVSVIGYFPRISEFSLDLPAEINAERTATIQRRLYFAQIGILLFVLASLFGSVIAIWALGLGATIRATP